MSKVKKFFLPVLMIFTIFCLGLSPITDVPTQADDAPSIVLVTGNAAEELVDATLRAVEEGEVETVAPVSAFGLEESSVYTVGGGVTAVTVPLHGDYSLPSNITVFFNADDTVLQTNEMLVTKNEVGNFQVETYLDGSFVNSQNTGISYITDEEMLAEEPLDPGVQPRSVGAVASCIGATLGVGATAAWLITVACGGSCAAPTPVTAPICAACIGAYAVLGAGGIAGVVACFQLL